MSLIILNCIAVMLIYMLPGFILYKKHIIINNGAKDMGKLLIYVILPLTIINSYNMDFSKEKAIMLFISFFVALFALLLSVVASRFFFRSEKNLESFGAAFSNAGFIGIPLISSVIGDDMIYCAAAFVAILNILQWTYGVFLITGDKSVVSARKIFFNPIIISFVLGVILFLLPVRLPIFLSEIFITVSQMNVPIAMFIVGIYMAQISLKKLFVNKLGYVVSAVRLLIIPLITTLFIAVLPFGNYALKLTIIILAATPIGLNVAVYAQLYGEDYKSAVKEIVLSTLLSVVTVPVVIQISEYILQNNPL